jgi:excisionase family DNA binding protein
MDNVIQMTRRDLREIGRAGRGTRLTYTVPEVADLLGLSVGSTYAAIRAGEIPAKQVGARWVISKERFHAWLNQADDEETNDQQMKGMR